MTTPMSEYAQAEVWKTKWRECQEIIAELRETVERQGIELTRIRGDLHKAMGERDEARRTLAWLFNGAPETEQTHG